MKVVRNVQITLDANDHTNLSAALNNYHKAMSGESHLTTMMCHQNAANWVQRLMQEAYEQGLKDGAK